MTVKYPIGENRIVKYTGVLNADALTNMIDQFLQEKDYDRLDLKNRYLTTKKGRLIEIETMYEKQYSDDDIFECKVELTFADVVPVTVKVDGEEQHLHKGRMTLEFTTFMRVNESGNWGGSAIKVFLNYLAYFFIFKHHYSAFKKDAKHDMKQLYERVMHYINGNRRYNG